MSSLKIMLLVTLLTYTTSTSCLCNIIPDQNIVSMSCEGQVVSSDCQCSYSRDVAFQAKAILNDGCKAEITDKKILLKGSNCTAGTTNSCTYKLNSNSLKDTQVEGYIQDQK